MNPLAELFGGNLYKIRELKGFTQEKLALKIGTTRATINRLERGHQWPQAETIYKIAGILEIEPLELFKADSDVVTDQLEQLAEQLGLTLPELIHDGNKNNLKQALVEAVTGAVNEAMARKAAAEKYPELDPDFVADLIRLDSHSRAALKDAVAKMVKKMPTSSTSRERDTLPKKQRK